MLTLVERENKVYEEAQKSGMCFRIEPTSEGEEVKYRNFTRADARAIIDAEDKRNEEELLNAEGKGAIKTSYGIVKTILRNEKMARNPRDKEAKPFLVPAHYTLKIVTTSRFDEKLNKDEETKIAIPVKEEAKPTA